MDRSLYKKLKSGTDAEVLKGLEKLQKEEDSIIETRQEVNGKLATARKTRREVLEGGAQVYILKTWPFVTIEPPGTQIELVEQTPEGGEGAEPE